MKSQEELIQKVFELNKYFLNTKYNGLVVTLNECMESRSFIEAREKIREFPTDKMLLDELVNKLKGKSVYTNLIKSRGETDLVSLKSLSSLLTHTIIECEKGNTEFKKLIPLLLEKINEISYKIL